ncbi:MAG: 4-hydroxythreonine-4-phosphate dehydrogenase PdxA [Dolichospermum sp.]
MAMTFGDAAGIGPEIIVKTFAEVAFLNENPAFVVGDAAALRRAAARWAPSLHVESIAGPEQHRPDEGSLQVVNTSDLPAELPLGRVNAAAGRAAFAAMKHAIDLANQGRIGAICTAPIHKEALAAAGVPFPGHTEMLADLSGTADYGMMLVNPQLRTLLVTVHCSIVEAVRKLSVALELRIIRLAHRSLQGMGIARPRIAVAGLNPHAGEGGIFGREDMDVIAPAVAQARSEGIDAVGPLPGDTVFMHARKGRYDIVVAQYHDQGLIPVKLLGVEDGVNVTVGLPFVRTSPDHGTAFDIAGLGVADPASLKTALATAHQLMRSSAQPSTH